MENRIKTALERALEKVGNLQVSESELLRMDLVPRGQAIAARFLQDKQLNLEEELGNFQGTARSLVTEGIQETLLHNIHPPANENAMDTNRRAMEGLLVIKEDKKTLLAIFSELEYLFQYYTEALKHTYANLKEAFSQRTDAAKQLLEEQMGIRVRVDVEKHPAFQDEWLRTLNELNRRYEAILDEHRERIRRLR
ncbi:MAG: DUF6657 family protein [Desulfotomaculales bacterium]